MNTPRRCRIDQYHPAEMAIYKAVQAVEDLPADTRLTTAVNFLTKAKDAVADFVDGVPAKPEPVAESGLLIAARKHIQSVQHHWPDTCKISNTFKRLVEEALIAGNPRPAPSPALVLTSAQIDAIESAVDHMENIVCVDLNRDVKTESCDDCGAEPGDACDDECGRAADQEHLANLRDLFAIVSGKA